MIDGGKFFFRNATKRSISKLFIDGTRSGSIESISEGTFRIRHSQSPKRRSRHARLPAQVCWTSGDCALESHWFANFSEWPTEIPLRWTTEACLTLKRTLMLSLSSIHTLYGWSIAARLPVDSPKAIPWRASQLFHHRAWQETLNWFNRETQHQQHNNSNKDKTHGSIEAIASGMSLAQLLSQSFSLKFLRKRKEFVQSFVVFLCIEKFLFFFLN